MSFGYESFPLAWDPLAQHIQTESARQAEVIKKAKAALD
jgi:hypothetical protein